MAKAHTRSRRSRRLSRIPKAICSQWLLVLLSHTLATICVMVVALWLHLPGCGGD